MFSLFTQLLSAQTIQALKAPLAFFIANDLGRNGYYQQKKIAELMIPWRPICGNHEYRGNTQAVLYYFKISRRWRIDEKYSVLPL